MKQIFKLVILLSLGSCTFLKPPPAPLPVLRLLGAYELPYNMEFRSTTVGGLSGIDYDPVLNKYYLISDDPSSINPARFYTADIRFDERGIENVNLLEVIYLLQPGGDTFPSMHVNPLLAPDPEAIRLDQKRRQLIWTSEGERLIKEIIVYDPFIGIADLNGSTKSFFPLPENLKMQLVEKGPRKNAALEGLSLDDRGKHLYVSLEEPLYEDGPQSGTGTNAMIRVSKFKMKKGKLLAQFAYQIDPIVKEPEPQGAFAMNGVSEILWMGKHQLFVMERSYSTGTKGSQVRLYLADFKQATNVINHKKLGEMPYVAMKKQLVLNLEQVGIYIDNLEGICFGPKLKDGRRTLVLVADNNFSASQKSQIIVFAIE
jgi:hypothetical protein